MDSNISIQINENSDNAESVIEEAVGGAIQLLAASARSLFRMGSKDGAKFAFNTVASTVVHV